MSRLSDIGIHFHIHMISDSTGETLMEMIRASVSQFQNVHPIEHLFALVRSPSQLDRALEHIRVYPGIVVFTVASQDLRRRLEECCAQMNMPALAVLDPIQATMSNYLGTPASSKVGAQHVLDAEYYSRIEAMDYSMAHDDGQGDDLTNADVILLGVSRTSKTPTSIYLGYRGVRAANIPLVPRLPLPDIVHRLQKPLIVGLTTSPERIIQIRRNRLLNLKENRPTEYVDEKAVKEEIIHAKRLFARYGWPSIDVTRISIEETAAKILKLLDKHRAQF